MHEAFLTFEGSWRQYGAALIHRLMTVILLRAATRVWVSIPGVRAALEALTPSAGAFPFNGCRFRATFASTRDEADILALRRRYAPDGGPLVGTFWNLRAPVLSVLEPIVLKITREIPDQTLLLMGVNSQEFREHLIEQHPDLENSVCTPPALWLLTISRITLPPAIC